jgi:hypothetical protein
LKQQRLGKCIEEDDMQLVDLTITATGRALDSRAEEFLAEGRSRFASVDCFDFVPSDYELVWRTLDALPRGHFCEWGSGFGLVTGLAEFLGFQASGIELNAELAAASRLLLAEFKLSAEIATGSYFDQPCHADVVFAYCWPSRIGATEEHFARHAAPEAKLLICYGQSDIRCKALA